MSAMVRAVESRRLSDLGPRFRLVTESCFDTDFSCFSLEGLCSKIHSSLKAAGQNGQFCSSVFVVSESQIWMNKWHKQL